MIRKLGPLTDCYIGYSSSVSQNLLFLRCEIEMTRSVSWDCCANEMKHTKSSSTQKREGYNKGSLKTT